MKRSQPALRELDFRRKSSWQTARDLLPPQEWKELWSEIEEAVKVYDDTLEKGLQLSGQLRRAADDLEALSEELLEEAGDLAAIQQASNRQKRARGMN
ncbi:MAG: hypothetical protein ACKO5F_10585 [Synechococcus sp.]